MDLCKEMAFDLYYNQKLPTKEIAKKLGCSTTTFIHFRKKWKMEPRPRERFIDMTGERYGKWLVLSVVHKNQKVLWKCLCDCGNEDEISRTSLIKYKSTKCRKCGYMRENFKMPAPDFYWTKVLNGAARRNLEVGVSQDFCRKLYHEQKGQCALTGVDLYCGKSTQEFNKGLNTASLDRIDSSKGYVNGNVQWVHKVVNNMKQDLDETEFKQWCKRIVTHGQ